MHSLSLRPVKLVLQKAFTARAFWMSIFLSPIVAVLSGSLKNQHADNIINTISSTENLTLNYWGSNRNGNLIAILSWPFQNLELNLKIQILIKTACFLFVLIFLVERIAYIFQTPKNYLIPIATLSSVYFLFKYPDAGDALIYGDGSRTIAFLLIIVAIQSSKSGFFRSSTTFQKAAFLAISQLCYIAVSWVNILWILRSPAFLVIELLVLLSFTDGRLTKTHLKFLSTNLLFSLVSFVTMVFLISSGDDNSSIVVRGSWGAVRNNWYIWDWLIICVIINLFVVVIGRDRKTFTIFLANMYLLAINMALTLLGHIHDNSFMPRYYGIGFIMNLVIATSAISSFIFGLRKKPRFDEFDRTRFPTQILLAPCFIVFLGLFAVGEVRYGNGYRDNIGFVKTGQALNIEQYKEIVERSGNEPEFVVGNYWDIWPTIYELRSSGVDILGVTTFGQFQSDFGRLFDGVRHYGVCLQMSPDNCFQIFEIALIDKSNMDFSIAEGYNYVDNGKIKYLMVAIESRDI